ncbi:MAG: hypothetical protein AAF911_02935 [Planctomycetota bacterium]
MTSEREAKMWMVAAGVLVVWACTMVGCTTPSAGDKTAALNRPAVGFSDPAWSSTPSIALSHDTAGRAEDDTSLAWSPADSAAVFVPSEPDVELLQPRTSPAPGFDAELSGLSIAQPLVSAKRLLVAAVTMLPPITTPEWAQATSAAAHAELSDQPVAAATGWAQRLAYDQTLADEPTVFHGLALRDYSSVMLPPWKTDPTPTTTVAAAMTADEAKFDSAIMVPFVIGGMVLLFGGEAVVMWMRARKLKIAKAVDAEIEIDDAEESIFRFPEPIEADADEPYSQAA